jgi:hypothetical protein
MLLTILRKKIMQASQYNHKKRHLTKSNIALGLDFPKKEQK